jgi:hypothetical protein
MKSIWVLKSSQIHSLFGANEYFEYYAKTNIEVDF